MATLRTDSYNGDPETLLPSFDLSQTEWIGGVQIKKLEKVNDSDEAWVICNKQGKYPFVRAKTTGAQDDPPVKIMFCETAQQAKEWVLSGYSMASVPQALGEIIWASNHHEAEELLAVEPQPLEQVIMTPMVAIQERENIVKAIGANSALMAKNSMWNGMSEILTTQMLRMYVETMYTARVVIWDLNLWMAATAKSREAFLDSPVKKEDVLVVPQYWTFDRDIIDGTTNLQEFFQAPCPVVITGIFVLPVGPYWKLIYKAAKDQIDKMDLGERVLMQARLEKPGVLLCYVVTPRYANSGYGLMLRFLPMGLWAGKCPEAYCHYMAAARFMNLKITEMRDETLPRTERRRYIKAGQTVPSIQTVLLRQVQSLSPEEGNPDARTANYGCHFLVGGLTGFWRRGKHHQNGDVGNPEYVEPFIKGDRTKPFRVNPNPTVYKVRR
jgi:hypothetical protein